MSQRLRLFLALLLPFAATGLQLLLWDNWIAPYVWFLFFPAAFLSAWLGGLSGGIGGTAISALLVWYVFMPPQFSFALQSPSSTFSIVVFVVMGCLFSWFHERLRSALYFSDKRFEATFERAAVGMAMMTPEGNLIRVNPAHCAITGRSAEELIGKSFKDITHPSDIENNLDCLRRLLAGEIDHFVMEKRFVRKNGDSVWTSVAVSLVRKPDGAPEYFIAVIDDISGRKRAEQRFRQLFEQSPIALTTSDRDGNILLMNQAFIDLFGYALVDTPTVAKWRDTVLTDPLQRAAAEQDRHEKWFVERPAELVEHTVRCRDGSRKTVLLSRMLLDGEMMLAAIDISTRKVAEDELWLRNQELERFNRASIDRELQMIALKREVNALANELGRAMPYDLSFADAAPHQDAP